MGKILDFFRSGATSTEAGQATLGDLEIACSTTEESRITQESRSVLERFGLVKGKVKPGKAPLWFVLRANGKPTGAACLLLEGNDARLIDIALLPDARGQNQGTAFMGHIVEALRQRGVQQLRASTRLTLKRFFAKLGFQPDGECFYADNALQLPISCSIAA